MLVACRVTPSIKFAGIYLYTWVEKDTVRVKCLAQEHNTISPDKDLTGTALSGSERTYHAATARPKLGQNKITKIFGLCSERTEKLLALIKERK